MRATEYPKYLRTRRIGESGVNAVATIVNDKFQWIFRRVNLEHDFGIDGYIDIVQEDGSVTGQSIAVQIKSGASFFKRVNRGNYIFTGEDKHLRYYLNLPTPVLIILFNENQNKCYWERFDLRATEPTNTGWRLPISKNKVFNDSSKSDLMEIAGPASEHTEAIHNNWEINRSLLESKADILLYAVEKREIDIGNTTHLKEFIDRLRLNNALCRRYQGKVEISVSGYDDDTRELFEIEEVVAWFEKADEKFVNWFFFLNLDSPGFGILTYLVSLSKAKRSGLSHPQDDRLFVTYDPVEMAKLLEVNFVRLNKIIHELGMTEAENRIISRKIAQVLQFPGFQIDEIFAR